MTTSVRSSKTTAPGTVSRPEGRRAADAGLGWKVAALLLVGSTVATLGLGLGNVVYPAFSLVAVAAAALLLRKGKPGAYVELCLWLWLATPGVRRVVDYGTVWHLNSLVTLAPALASLVGLPSALRQRRAVLPEAALAFMVAAVVLPYSLAVGVVQNGAAPAVASLLNWLGPLALGYFVLVGPVDREALRHLLVRVIRFGLLLLAVYGVVQWWLAPAWDTLWMRNVADLANSFGQPRPYQIRVFSLLNSPVPLAAVLAWMLIAHTGADRWRWAVASLLVGYLAFGLTQVRAAWVVWLVAVAMLAARRRVRVLRVAVVIVALIGLAQFSAPIRKTIGDRISGTVASGTSDESFVGRLRFQQRSFPDTLRDPVGRGLGSSGTATRLGGSTTSARAFADVDSGYLESLRVFGLVPGIALLASVLYACVRAWRRTRNADDFACRASAFLVAVPVGMVFGNFLVGVAGAVVWLLLGLLGRAPPLSAAIAPPGTRR